MTADKSGDIITIKHQLSEDKRSCSLDFSIGGTSMWKTNSNAAAIDEIIRALDDTRSHMFDPVSDSPEPGKVYPSAFNPRWQVRPDPENKFAVLWIRNSGTGWYAYGIPRHEAVNLVGWLRKIPTFSTPAEKLASLPPQATSFGGDEFVITTAGLGFYYYGKGEKRIGPNPFEQIEFDSDRAAGIVAGSIAEKRLQQALLSLMKSDKPEISGELFRPSGPLGPFSTKIHLGYLLGLLSPDALKDLTTIKNIRNDFAHHLDMDAFDVPSIRDRCRNLLLVDRHIGPVPSFSEGAPSQDQRAATPYLGLPNYEERLADPRFRYVMTAQLISFQLGMGAENAERTLPLV